MIAWVSEAWDGFGPKLGMVLGFLQALGLTLSVELHTRARHAPCGKVENPGQPTMLQSCHTLQLQVAQRSSCLYLRSQRTYTWSLGDSISQLRHVQNAQKHSCHKPLLVFLEAGDA